MNKLNKAPIFETLEESKNILLAGAGGGFDIFSGIPIKGSELWINPLMTIYWCFNLRNVVRKIKYYDYIKDTNTIREFNGKLAGYRSTLKEYRKNRQIPI